MCPNPINRRPFALPYEEQIRPGLIIRFNQTEIARERYETVQVNNGPVWMARNLRTDEGGDHDICPFRKGGSCHSHPDPSYAEVYGRYYTFETAVEFVRRLGGAFRLPSDEDWREFLTVLGGKYDPATQSFGSEVRNFFLCIPQGKRMAMHWGGCRWPGAQAYWGRWQGIYWSSTTVGSQQVWCYGFSNTSRGVYRFRGYQRNSYSVRLIKSAS